MSPQSNADNPVQNAETIRLSKYMAQSGLCSRREADRFIAAGLVFVDGLPAKLGDRVHPAQKIEMHPDAILSQAKLRTVILHKPPGYVSGNNTEGAGRPASELLTKMNQHDVDDSSETDGVRDNSLLAGKFNLAGRLMLSASGLLVFTENGLVAKELTERHQIENEYHIRLDRELPHASLVSLQLQFTGHGSSDAGGSAAFRSDPSSPRGVLATLVGASLDDVLDAIEREGLTIQGVKRIRIGGVQLGDLPIGQWRFLGSGEFCVDEFQNESVDMQTIQTEEPIRGTGRTTAGMLRTISHALETPEQWVPYADHSGVTDPDLFQYLFLQLSKQLNLCLCVRRTDCGVEIHSALKELQAQRLSPNEQTPLGDVFSTVNE